MRPGPLLLILAAAAVAASPASACRQRFFTEKEARDRTALFTATVDSLERTHERDGQRIFVTLRLESAFYGEPPGLIRAHDILPDDDAPDDGVDPIIVTSSCNQRWIGDELGALSVGDEVVVLTWRRDTGETVVSNLGRTGGTRAQRLLHAPRP